MVYFTVFMILDFPNKFKFGVADADLQVIGEKNTRQYEDSEPTMWNDFARTSGKCYQDETPDIGIDRYHKWQDDIEIMKKIGIKHYRTSVSMSRLLTRNGDVNTKAVQWYKKYFRSLSQAGIKIYVTLYHWELPQYLNEKGGWKNRATINALLNHSQCVAENLGEFIEEYFILNEPRCSSLVSFYLGAHPPGETNLKSALLAAHNLLFAQGVIANSLISKYPNIKLSTAINVGPRYPASLDAKDIDAAKFVDGQKNLWFLDPIFLGKYPEYVVDIYGKNMPEVSREDMEIIKIGNKLHSLGLNYYRGDTVKYNSKKDFNVEIITNKKGVFNGLGWPVYMKPHYPEGFYDILSQVYFSYKDYGLKRIYITENGMAEESSWDGKSKIVKDEKRVFYLQEHLRQMHEALHRGIPIEAYFAWTLMDNYEWAEGYKPNSAFGLIYIDRKTQKRIWKESAHWYSNLIKSEKLNLKSI